MHATYYSRAYDLRSFIKEKLKVAKEMLDAYGQAYRERNGVEEQEETCSKAT